MAKIRGAVVIDTDRCKGCDLCVVACPTDVLALGKEVNSKGYNYAQIVKPEECIGCVSCGYVCPDGCITVYKVKNGN
jgi:2-oxoglutarate ferredoxin oxidoreductase subunit delta